MPVKEFFGCREDGWPVVQLEVKWSQFSWGRKKVCAANRLTIKNEDSCLAERCRGEAADGLGIWAVWCEVPKVGGPRGSPPVQGLGASSLTWPLEGLQNCRLTPLKSTIKRRVPHSTTSSSRNRGNEFI